MKMMRESALATPSSVLSRPEKVTADW